MTHPTMFTDGDPVLARVRELALALPEAAEKISHGRPVFFTGKVFAHYGGSEKGHHGHEQHPRSVIVKPDEEEARALREDPRCFVPAYLGPSGWVGLDLDDDTDWAEVAELLEISYRLTAPARCITALDARG